MAMAFLMCSGSHPNCVVGIQAGILVIGILVVDLKPHGSRKPNRKVGATSVLEREESASVLGLPLPAMAARFLHRLDSATAAAFDFRVILLNETAGVSDQIKPHQFLPILRMFTFLKGSERADGTLMPADELRLGNLAQEPFRANADVFVVADEQPQLAGKVKVNCSRAQLSSMVASRSAEMSMHHRSVHRSLNQAASFCAAS